MTIFREVVGNGSWCKLELKALIIKSFGLMQQALQEVCGRRLIILRNMELDSGEKEAYCPKTGSDC